jgi:hypothetical protein
MKGRRPGATVPDRLILDVHTHAFPEDVAADAIPKLEAGAVWFECRATFDGTVAGLLASMDKAGIRRAVVCSVATRPQQVRKITEWSASVASERIVPFASIHPDVPDPEAEAERIAGAGLRGLKFHPYYMQCPLDDPRTIRVARAAARVGLAILFHTGYDFAFPKDDLAGPEQVRRLHEAVPELRMAAGHLGGWQRWHEVLRSVAGLPVYLETSFTLGRCPDALVLEILARHPPQYLMFGTDAPWTDQAAEVKEFLALPIAEDFKRRILWENGHRFLGMAQR